MSNSFTNEVKAVFPEARITHDDETSVSFYVHGFILGSRKMSTGWAVEVRDLRNTTYELADEVGYDDLEKKEMVVPKLKELFDSLLNK